MKGDDTAPERLLQQVGPLVYTILVIGGVERREREALLLEILAALQQELAQGPPQGGLEPWVLGTVAPRVAHHIHLRGVQALVYPEQRPDPDEMEPPSDHDHAVRSLLALPLPKGLAERALAVLRPLDPEPPPPPEQHIPPKPPTAWLPWPSKHGLKAAGAALAGLVTVIFLVMHQSSLLERSERAYREEDRSRQEMEELMSPSTDLALEAPPAQERAKEQGRDDLSELLSGGASLRPGGASSHTVTVERPPALQPPKAKPKVAISDGSLATAPSPMPAEEPKVELKDNLEDILGGLSRDQPALPPPPPPQAQPPEPPPPPAEPKPLPDGALVLDEVTIEEGEMEELPTSGEGGQAILTPPLGTTVAEDRESDARGTAERFLAGRAVREGLRFKEARGYWANTYIPGDRELRNLQSRLATWSRGFLGEPLRLHDAAHQAGQPFDSPEEAALAVYLHADRRGLGEGAARMLVQVGIQATARRGGVRPAMNVGVVLDLPPTMAVESQAAVRSLLEAFAKARLSGDRFSLIVAGYPGGLRVAPEDFNHGTVSLAVKELLSGQAQGHPVNLAEAVAEAWRQVGQDDDAPLGTSVIVLVATRPLGLDLTGLAHRSAVDGLSVSVMAVGRGADLAELDRLALAGQGNRRVLVDGAEAEGLVDRELSAVSRVVARALRLRIRLAPGVRLVDVVGSYRLDERQAQRVRQAEKSIDQRMSRNLGLQADRGEDEEGLQMIIPTYYAGDAHVVLLDVVAQRPGPVADVTVRYKDLVYLRNGVARANLSLGRSSEPPGALELGVLKSYLAYELSQRLKGAGQALEGGDEGRARSMVREAQRLLEGLGQAMPLLARDRDLHGDSVLLAEYARALETAGPGDRAGLGASFRYAGMLKVLPRPAL